MPEARMRAAAMRQARKDRHRKSMKDRHGEQDGGNDFNGLRHDGRFP
jgi:hypothetical protein